MAEKLWYQWEISVRRAPDLQRLTVRLTARPIQRLIARRMIHVELRTSMMCSVSVSVSVDYLCQVLNEHCPFQRARITPKVAISVNLYSAPLNTAAQAYVGRCRSCYPEFILLFFC